MAKFAKTSMSVVAIAVLMISSAVCQDILDTTNATCNLTKTTPSTHKNTFTYNNNCMIVEFSAYLKLPNETFVAIENPKVNDESVCGDNSTPAKLVIDFDCGSLALQFKRNDSFTFVQAINGQFRLPTNPNATFSNSSELFKTNELGHYYKCESKQEILNANKTQALMLSHIAFEVFRTTNSSAFTETADICLMDTQPASDLVRIGVGVCLVALVAIVLVAYFVGRKRWAERMSYETV